MTTKKLNTMLENLVKITDKLNKTHIGILHKITRYYVNLEGYDFPILTNNCYLLECFNESIIYQSCFIKRCNNYKSPVGLPLNKLLK